MTFGKRGPSYGAGSPAGRVQGHARALFLDMNGRALRAPDVGEVTGSRSAWDQLASIGVPTAVVVGDLDERDVIAIGRKIADEVPGAALTELPGSAHLPPLDAVERFAEVTGAFLDRLG